ncbi:hypothetical protein GWG54_20045 [Natronococcus sp. JC468]|uniref:HalOD1 output domain-containing protein n=1 Tax=Natronococcus sp. JC468 TaxID=1961921 RepID=UPI00143BDF4D|nr:hypothetical protein [Natronococcus sp. JC468]
MDNSDEKLISVDCDWSANRPSIVIVRAISSIENVEPTSLSMNLSNHTDPVALDSFMSNSNNPSVSFQTNRYIVQLTSDKLFISYC